MENKGLNNKKSIESKFRIRGLSTKNLNDPFNEYFEKNLSKSLAKINNTPKKSVFIIPFSKIIQKIAKNTEITVLKVPVFPKYEFGKHIEMANIVPEFRLISTESQDDHELINKMKIEGGRLKKNLSFNLPKIYKPKRKKVIKTGFIKNSTKLLIKSKK
jgi:hypothetical protein